MNFFSNDMHPTFHKDIDYSEQVEYLLSAVAEEEIKTFLIDKATDIDFPN